MKTKILYAAVLLILFAFCVQPLANAMTADSLRNEYDGEFAIGFTHSAEILNESTAGIVARHFDTLILSDVLSPAVLINSNNELDFTAADAVYAKARENGYKIIGGPLVSPIKTPITTSDTREEAISKLEAYITTVIARYPEIDTWIVTDNALLGNFTQISDWEGLLTPNPWLETIGADYIGLSFDFARKAASGAVLYYADNGMQTPAKQTVAANMLSDLKNAGSTINGCFISGTFSIAADTANLSSAINRFAELGIITSLCLTNGNDFSDNLAYAYRIAEIFTLLAENKQHVGFAAFDGFDKLFTGNMQTTAIFDAVSNPAVFILENPGAANLSYLNRFIIAEYGAPAISSSSIDPIWNNARAFNINNYVYGSGGATATARIMWSRSNLLIHIEVTDPTPDPADKVTVYINENIYTSSLEQSSSFEVDYTGSYEKGLNASANITVANKVTDNGYYVQLHIPLRYRFEHNNEIGLDIRITDMNAGRLVSIAQFNDLSNLTPDPSHWSRLILQNNSELHYTLPIMARQSENIETQGLRLRFFTIFFILVFVLLMCTLIYLSKRANEKKIKQAPHTEV